MQKNVSGQKIGCQMVSAADGSAFTGSVTVSVTGDAGTQATGSVGSGACAHEGNGYHTYAPAQAETNYDLIAFTFTGTGAVPATVQVYTRHDANLTHSAGTAITSSGGRPEVNTTHAAGTAWGSGAITAASIATDAITAAKVASDAGTEIAAAVWASAARTLTSLSGLTLDTVTTLTNLPTMPTDWLTAAGLSAGAVAEIQSGLSTYAGGDTSGTTTLLSRLSSTRAGYLDNLSGGAVMLAASYSAPPSAATVASQVRTELATELGRLDAAVSSRMATFTLPTNFSSLAINASGHVSRVTLTDTITTYTGDTPQTGDSFARLGAPAGASLAADVATKPTLAQILAGGDVDGYTLEQTLKLCLAALAGKLSGAATTTVTIRAADDSKVRITATVDADGNRTSVTYDAAG